MVTFSVLDGCMCQVENVVADTPTELFLEKKNLQDIIFQLACIFLICQMCHVLDPMMQKGLKALSSIIISILVKCQYVSACGTYKAQELTFNSFM